MKEEPDPPKCPVPPEHPPDVRNLVGLAFSGGGIRSASFNLGVLQGLASRDQLWIFDYLSTVSGGGFIGSWWSAWLSRKKRLVPAIFPEDEELEPGRRADTAVLLRGKEATPLSPGPPDGSRIARRDDPIHFLRLFSNYLTPKAGAFSPDTWRLIAFYVRGLLFTWVVLVPLLLVAVMSGQGFFMTNGAAPAFVCAPGPQPAAAPASAPPTNLAAKQRVDYPDGYCAGTSTPWLSAQGSRETRLKHLAKPMVFLFTVYATLAIVWLVYASSPWWLALASFIAVAMLALKKIVPYFGSGQADPFYEWAIPMAMAIGLFLHGGQALFKRLLDRERAVEGGGAGPAAGSQATTPTADDYLGMLGKQQATLLELMVFLGVLLLLAGFGHDVVDWMVGKAQSKLGAVGWSGVAMALVSGGYTVFKALPNTHGTSDAVPGTVGKILVAIAPPLVLVVLGLALAWLSHALLMSSANQAETGRLTTLVSVATFLGVLQVIFAIVESHRDPAMPPAVSAFWHRVVPESLLPRSVQGTGRPGAGRWLYLFSPRGWVRVSVLVSLIALWYGTGHGIWAFLTFMAAATMSLTMPTLAVSMLAAIGVVTFVPRTWPLALGSARPAALLSITSGTATLSLLGGSVTAPTDGVAFIAPLWIAILIGFVICMGWLADPNLLSIHGFYKGRLARAYLGASNTARLNEEVTDSAPCDDIALTAIWNHDAGGPYHLINTTLSLVGGSDLAMSQRSAENFIMSRYHCGSARAGYRCTADYMDGQLSLATATAISGAAVSPNMGSKTPSAALALFLSLFNVRLGFWAPTPSGRRWREPHARLWPFYILRETLSNTGQIGTYCYLTDGGHFDNTGLYALVERGCRYIVISDCGADPDLGFEDIGVAIRRCRIDFGAEIDLRIDAFANRTRRDRMTKTHVVRGTIRYQPAHLDMLGFGPESAEGVIVWIKPAVTQKDVADVQQYHRANTDFPQQSTADQWYDESQFESYRRLGYDSARDAFDDLPALAPGDFAAIPAWFGARG